MHRHSKFILVIFLLACGLSNTPEVAAWQQKEQTQQEPQSENTGELPPPPEAEQDTYTDDENTDETYVDDADEAYTDEEYNNSPFPEIVTPPKRVERQIGDAQWSRMTNDEAFRYEDPAPVKQKADGDNWWLKMFVHLFTFLASTTGNYLILGIVALIILFIIIRVVQLRGNIFFSKKDKKLSDTGADELSDEYVPDDWEKVIREAANAGNYRLAVRHGYRYLLSLLQEKEMISYQVAKTNYQYVFEMAGTPWHKPFMQLTRDYEYAWYGGFSIQQDRFEDYYQKVSSIKKELDQKG